MLLRLEIIDFAIADRLMVEFGPGFNVITGETGAGKSLVVDALALLFGGRADSDWIRAGARSARIEGIFEGADSDELAELFDPAGIPSDPTLILGRELSAGGRGVARINGRSVPVALLIRP